MAIHGLNDQIPKRFYLNKEQSPKPRSGGLTQAGIKRAFAGTQRESRLIYRFDDSEVALLSGKNTGNLEAIEMDYGGTRLRVTSLERTLIDIAVRPAYAGGPLQVLCRVPRGKRPRVRWNHHRYAKRARLHLPVSSGHRLLYAAGRLPCLQISKAKRSGT
jgi:predicted transcriptional regulator of viral defense system